LDAVTQITLGAAIGEATLGRRVGARAMAWGAVCAILPDLDVFVPLGDVVRDFTYHRSATHSLLVLAVLSPLMVWLILKVHPQTAPHRLGWLALVLLAFLTHPLLDSFTVYGTQLLWPLDDTPVALSSIFIIDPAYTLPLLIGVIAVLVLSRERPLGHRLNWAGLALSSCYLIWTLGAKMHVEQVAKESLADQGIAYEHLLTVPTPFNSLAWRVLATRSDGYHDGFYSVFDDDRHISMSAFPSQPELLNGIEDHWPVKRLMWFTRGFYSVRRIEDAVVITDLRMGLEDGYVFRFKVGEIGNPHATPSIPERVPSMRDMLRVRKVWTRIWNEVANI
jgi:inner membrane protein